MTRTWETNTLPRLVFNRTDPKKQLVHKFPALLSLPTVLKFCRWRPPSVLPNAAVNAFCSIPFKCLLRLFVRQNVVFFGMLHESCFTHTSYNVISLVNMRKDMLKVFMDRILIKSSFGYWECNLMMIPDDNGGGWLRKTVFNWYENLKRAFREIVKIPPIMISKWSPKVANNITSTPETKSIFCRSNNLHFTGKLNRHKIYPLH